MSLMICPHCHKPRLTTAAVCPHCGRSEQNLPQTVEPEETKGGLACLILMMLFVIALILLPIILIAGIFIR